MSGAEQCKEGEQDAHCCLVPGLLLFISDALLSFSASLAGSPPAGRGMGDGEAGGWGIPVSHKAPPFSDTSCLVPSCPSGPGVAGWGHTGDAAPTTVRWVCRLLFLLPRLSTCRYLHSEGWVLVLTCLFPGQEPWRVAKPLGMPRSQSVLIPHLMLCSQATPHR